MANPIRVLCRSMRFCKSKGLSCSCRFSFWIGILLAAATGQCGVNPLPDSQPPALKNIFLNGSFEQGKEPWFALVTPNWESFRLTDRHAAHGPHAAHLALHAGMAAEGTKIVGVIQEVTPQDFPKRLSGSYRIERWKRGTPKQYIQVVVIVIGDTSERPFSNYQIRYILAGIDKPPLRILNARYILAETSELQKRSWIRFDFDLHSDFQRQWGRIPKGFSKIRVLFEVRYDEKNSGEGEVRAEIYYDDLYLGD
jgi:hypothetical protein